ncbi:MAG TPA: glycerophosphodiester phosphodiesterase family protein [Candidatus Saccharimonadales bacterium]
MIIISHRGAAGLKPENTIAAIRAGYQAGADMIEFDIRVTKDNVPILSHDFHTFRTHKKMSLVRRLTLSELRRQHAGSDRPVVTLDEALKETFGTVMLNIEIKHTSAVGPTLTLIQQKYIKKPSDWDAIMFSSFSVRILQKIRKLVPKAQLAMLHSVNSLSFVAYERQLRLAAVGFHRLRVTNLAIEVAKRLGLFIYVYTVNRPEAVKGLAQKGIDGIVTDFPNKFS